MSELIITKTKYELIAKNLLIENIKYHFDNICKSNSDPYEVLENYDKTVEKIIGRLEGGYYDHDVEDDEDFQGN